MLHAVLITFMGLLTAVPLVLFAVSAQSLPLSTIGLLQYITPTMQFLLGVAVFHEPMSPTRWAGFGLVWLALVVLSVDGVRAARATRLASRP